MSFLAGKESSGRIGRSSREVGPTNDTLRALNGCAVRKTHCIILSELNYCLKELKV